MLEEPRELLARAAALTSSTRSSAKCASSSPWSWRLATRFGCPRDPRRSPDRSAPLAPPLRCWLAACTAVQALLLPSAPLTLILPGICLAA